MGLLNPNDRALLIESLRPPVGYQLDTAIATTFSLDLISLMVAPVGFTLFDLDPDNSSVLDQDPLEILESIRRHASQIVLFCQAGRIAVPTRHRPLLTYLEERIVEAKAPTADRSFHPKVWIIRYVNQTRDVAYRLLCSSRNLTFDRCWDTLLTLDGPFRGDRTTGFGFNAGLQQFVASLPNLAISASQVTDGIRQQLRNIEKEISRVEWELDNTPFDSLKFWPLGHDGVKTWPFNGRRERTLVISPFVTATTLGKLASSGHADDVLVSRGESLDAIDEVTLQRFADCYQLSSQGAILDPDSADVGEALQTQLQGLHAKLYISDDGRNGRVWTGSANATAAAFGGNVEFLVELVGKKSEIGVDAFLEKAKGVATFADLLEPYDPPESTATDTQLEALKNKLDALRLPLADAHWNVSVSPGETTQNFIIAVNSTLQMPNWPSYVSVTCRPLSIGESFAAQLESGAAVRATFHPVALESLTAFLVLEVAGATVAGKHSIQFVVNATITGAPSNRKERVLQSMLRDQRDLMRLLSLLLSDIGDTALEIGGGSSKPWRRGWNADASHDALLEPLLRTLARNPTRLKAVKSLLVDLARTDDGANLIPDGLIELFDAIWAATPGAEA
ncbi:MAG: hypothetical protein H0X34_08170 [Chthoniobacterales bacterium]|nr:hypothetical protein [Chthoniobacterales bacterium]